MKKTTNYGQFKFAGENRNIDEAHVRKLKRSIEVENLLEFAPIIVDDKLTVIDGQHRLQAAKELDVPIYYVVHKGGDFVSMTTLNTASKNWTLLDFANAYAAKGNESYEYVLKICEELKINVSVALRLLLNMSAVHARATSTTTPTAIFKEGKLKVSLADYIQAKEKGMQIISLADYVPSCRSSLFVMTMLRLFNNPDFDIMRLESQLFDHQKELPTQSRVRDYLRDIEDVYNYGKQQKNRVRLYEV